MHVFAEKLEFLEGTKVQITFVDGKIMAYDLASLISKYPFLKVLEDREFFLTGRIDVGGCGVVWNDDVDFDVMDAYECGELVGA